MSDILSPLFNLILKLSPFSDEQTEALHSGSPGIQSQVCCTSAIISRFFPLSFSLTMETFQELCKVAMISVVGKKKDLLSELWETGTSTQGFTTLL